MSTTSRAGEGFGGFGGFVQGVSGGENWLVELRATCEALGVVVLVEAGRLTADGPDESLDKVLPILRERKPQLLESIGDGSCPTCSAGLVEGAESLLCLACEVLVWWRCPDGRLTLDRQELPPWGTVEETSLRCPWCNSPDQRTTALGLHCGDCGRQSWRYTEDGGLVRCDREPLTWHKPVELGRLIGQGLPGRPSTYAGEPVEVAPERCTCGDVLLPELRVITGGRCWGCHEGQ